MKMLKPKLPLLEPRLPLAPTPRANRSGRDADPRRALKLNTAAWQRLRASVITEEPLCRHCSERGLIVCASDVDHISGDPSDNSRDNLQSLCHSCHSIKTAADHGKRVATGCDANGIPSHWKKSPAVERARPAAPLFFNPKSDHQGECE